MRRMLIFFTTALTHHPASIVPPMDEPQQPNLNNMTELDMCKTALCFKEHELFTLRADVQTQQAILQSLSQSIERLERTLSAGMDRLARSVNRLGKRDSYYDVPDAGGNSKRRKRDHY